MKTLIKQLTCKLFLGSLLAICNLFHFNTAFSISEQNERSHLFFYPKNSLNSKGVIGDEGWRWRKSLDFIFLNKIIQSTFFDSSGTIQACPNQIHGKLKDITDGVFFSIKIDKVSKDDSIIFRIDTRNVSETRAVFLENTNFNGNTASFANGDQFYIDQDSVLIGSDGKTSMMYSNRLYCVNILNDQEVEITLDGATILKSETIVLSNTAATMYKKTSSVNLASAALTIIFENGKAYSKLLQKDDKTIIASAGQSTDSEIKCLGKIYAKAPFCSSIKNMINGLLETNITNNINDAEAKLIYELLKDDQPTSNTLRSNIDELLRLSQETYDKIQLIVLHIHTQMDPCAICSKIIVGLSRQMNKPATTQSTNMRELLNAILPPNEGGNHLGSPIALRSNLRSGRCRFLIEVSSSKHFSTRSKKCSHAECSGRDEHYDDIINVATSTNKMCTLAIPYGLDRSNTSQDRNWKFLDSFPPYVIFARLNDGLNTCDCNNSEQHDVMTGQQISQVTPILNTAHSEKNILPVPDSQ